MTLAEFQTQLRVAIAEETVSTADVPSQEYLTDARATWFINASMQHLVNLLVRTAPSVLAISSTGSPSATGANELGTITPTYPPYKILWARSAGNDALSVVDYGEVGNKFKGSAQSAPAISINQDDFVLVEPTSGNYTIHYVPFFPNMIAGTDTPGQFNGAGTLNLLPQQYHPYIVTYAALLALASENREMANVWDRIWAEQRRVLISAVASANSSDEWRKG